MHELVESSLSIDASDRNEPISLLYDVSFRLFRKTFPFVFFFFIGKASSKSTFIYLSIGSLSLCEFEGNEKLQFYWILSCG